MPQGIVVKKKKVIRKEKKKCVVVHADGGVLVSHPRCQLAVGERSPDPSLHVTHHLPFLPSLTQLKKERERESPSLSFSFDHRFTLKLKNQIYLPLSITHTLSLSTIFIISISAPSSSLYTTTYNNCSVHIWIFSHLGSCFLIPFFVSIYSLTSFIQLLFSCCDWRAWAGLNMRNSWDSNAIVCWFKCSDLLAVNLSLLSIGCHSISSVFSLGCLIGVSSWMMIGFKFESCMYSLAEFWNLVVGEVWSEIRECVGDFRVASLWDVWLGFSFCSKLSCLKILMRSKSNYFDY